MKHRAVMDAKADALLLALRRDVYTWRLARLSSAAFYAEHGEVVATEPLNCEGRPI